MASADGVFRLRIFFVSDLHIQSEENDIGKKFLGFLSFVAEAKADLLLLGGDIFDLLVGSFEFWDVEFRATKECLHRIHASGCRIVWIQGNHDFQIEGLARRWPVEIVDQEFDFTVPDERRIHLTHGDLINQDDQAYLKWRSITRSLALKAFLNACPAIFARVVLKPLGQKISQSSRKRHPFDADLPEIKALFRQYAEAKWGTGVFGVFAGHSHVPDLHTNSEGKFLVNLGSGLNGALRYADWNTSTESFPKVLSY